MERLFQISEQRIQNTQAGFIRFLANEIRWEDRMIGISGARGSGKTTLILQRMKSILSADVVALYASLDDLYFAETSLLHLAESFNKKGGDYLFLDEVHKYPNWSRELKNIYDNLPGLKVIFTSSSALDIYKGAYDLSRRAMVYNLPGLSFREFIELKYAIKLPVFTLDQVLFDAGTIVPDILKEIRPLKYFEEYLRLGYYPFFIESEENYHIRLTNILNQVLDSDLTTIFNIDYYSVMKMKKMLAVLSRIVPYKPNIENLSKQTGTTRDTLLKYLYYLEKAEVVKWLTKSTNGINYLNKPDKLYLNNTNLSYALSNEKPDKGNLRETFFLNQLLVKQRITYPEQGDFLIDGKYLIEVGGMSKNSKQIAGLENAFLAIDDVEYADGNRIPLWLFGFLY
jgi:predicted AAA+ superfamily ATPase